MDDRSTEAPSLLSKVLTAAIALLLSLCALEAGLRTRQWVKHGTFGRSAGGEFVVDENTGLKTPRPNSKIRASHVNSKGFRGPEVEVPKPERNLRLAFVGASTTFCTEINEDSETWPHLVTDHLQQEFPRYRFDYVNAGVPGYRTAHSLLRLRENVAPMQPDIVVIYHSNNDLAFETASLARSAGVHRQRSKDPLESISLAWSQIKKNLAFFQISRLPSQDQERLSLVESGFQQGFRNRLRDLVKESQEIAELTVLPTFTYQIRREQSPEDRLRNAQVALYYMPYLTPESLLYGYETYNEVIREVASEMKALLVEVALEIEPTDVNFADTMHLRSAGSQDMARILAAAIAEDPEFRRLVTD